MAKKKPEVKGKETKTKEPKETKVKEKKEKKVKEPAVIEVKCKKNESAKEIDPRTGSRFRPGTSKQIALELIVDHIKEGKSQKDIRASLKGFRKENGKDRDLDPGYFPFVVASHPEYFEVWNTGEVKLLKEFTPDPEAAKKMEEAAKSRSERKEKRKSSKKDTGKKTGKKKPTIAE